MPYAGRADSGFDSTGLVDAARMAAALPIGSVFIAVVSTNPATLLGYGTWSAIAAGRVLVGLNSGDTDFDAVKETGGAKTVVSTGTVSQPTFSGNALATHTHTYTDVVNHTHTVTSVGSSATGAATNLTGASDTSSTTAVTANPSGGVATGTTAGTSAGTPAGTVTQPTFTGNATSVVQPYYVVYMWERTA